VILSFAWVGGVAGSFWGFIWGIIGLAGAICGAIAAFHVAVRPLTFFVSFIHTFCLCFFSERFVVFP
jgi:hypothetical protein